MPQLQLPLFPAGSRRITEEIAVECRDHRVVYIYGSLPMFQHEEEDLRSFRLFTSQLIDMGAARQVDIVKAFGVPLPTVKRYLKLLREEGSKAFFAEPKRRSAAVLHGEARQIAESLLAEGRGEPEVAQAGGVKANTLHKAIRAGRLPGVKEKVFPANPEALPTKSERSEIDSTALMGYGATRAEPRMAASLGLLESAPIEFGAAQDVTGGGVLLAVPALLAMGLLPQRELYALLRGYYGLAGIPAVRTLVS